jgi:hypothetical protein
MSTTSQGGSASEGQSSPYSTGGGGTTLEHRYGAVLMSRILSSDPVSVLGDEFTPTKLSFQVPLTPIDDFVLEGQRSNGAIRRVAIAVRRDPKLVKTNDASVKLFGSFIEFISLHADDLAAGNWRMAVAVGADSVHAKQLKTLIEIARDQTSNEDFRSDIGRRGRTTPAARTRLGSLDKLVLKALENKQPGVSAYEAAEMTWKILTLLQVESLQLEGASNSDRTSAVTALRGVHPLGTAEAANELFQRLAELSARYAASQAVKGSLQLQRDLGLRMRDGLWDRQLEAVVHVEAVVSARRQSRRAIVGLPDSGVDASFQWDPKLPQELEKFYPGEVLALTGPIGSGKSDSAERWLLAVTQEFKSGESFSLPVWLRAEDLDGPLERVVRAELKELAPSAAVELDVSIVIDGMDERPTGGEKIALEAKVFAAAHPRSRVLLTTREAAVGLNIQTVRVPEFSSEEAENLIARVAEVPRIFTYDWPESLRASIKRPLFALLAAAQLRDNKLSTPASLIRTAAEHGARGTVDTGILRKLAVALTRSGRAVDPILVLPGTSAAALRASRLIVVEESRCRFALPVFQQWFAAEALLTGEVTLDEVTSDLLSFAKWRYALAACLSSGTRESVDPMMRKLGEWNPGVLGWLIEESIPHALGTRGGASVGAWRTEAQRVWNATASICEGLGATARQLVRPTQAVGTAVLDPFSCLSLNLQTSGRQIAQNWRMKGGGRPQFTSEPVDWFSVERDFITAKVGTPSDHENWLWRWVIDDIAGDLSKALQDITGLDSVTRVGIVARERVSWICRQIAQHRRADGSDSTQTAVDRISSLLDAAVSEGADLGRSSFSFGGARIFRGTELLEVIAVLNGDPTAERDIWPGRDLGHGGWVWGGYSKERMLERVREVYEGAMMAYEEIRSAVFSTFGLTLGHAALFPAAIVGTLKYDPEDESLGGAPVLSYSIRPHKPERAGNNGIVDISLLGPNEPRKGFQEVLAELDERYAHNPEARLFGRPAYVETALDIFHERPATFIALDWLWSDLKQIGWAVGSQPRH